MSAERSVELQKIIFTRWCAQKLSKVGIETKDITKELSDGWTLVKLLEILSEKPCPEKLEPAEKIKNNKFAKIANIEKSLKFCFNTCGIQMKIKPSNENLFDGTPKECLGLIWAIMFKYMKIGDDDEEEGQKAQTYNAKDALLMWVKNKLQGYNLKTEGWGKDWHDGMALCAILHKHRPKLINYESLSPSNKTQNLQTAIDAANKYFDLEKYLGPDDIPKLDENSMFVYVSEYYYGIAEQRKLDLAAKRIGKVIKLTIENDAMRKEYRETAERFKQNVAKVVVILEDRTIDNTMAGAKKRLEDFYAYKKNDKNGIISDSLDLEALFNNLATRLAHNKRPPFVPPEGTSLQDIDKTIKHLEECERERKISLHKELNRQLRLLSLDEQHKSRFQKFKKWAEEKEQKLRTKEIIESVSAAQLQLRLLDAYDKEEQSTRNGTWVEIKKLGAELEQEKYERTNEVKDRETDIQKTFDNLAQLSKDKRPVLEDDLAREIFKEKVRLRANQHLGRWKKICAWIEESEKYLNKVEDINSVSEAETQLILLEAFGIEKDDMKSTNVVKLEAQGKQIIEAKYETQYSNWVYEKPDEIREHEKNVQDKWVQLGELSEKKKQKLIQDLEREKEKERLRVEFASLANDFIVWAKEITEGEATVNDFGFELEEVEAYNDVFNKRLQEIESIRSQKYEGYNGIWTKMQEMNVTENPYTTLTPQNLEDARNTMNKALEGKREAYQKELERQRYNDKICREFAAIADPFVKWINETKESVTGSQSDLEKQLEFVNAKISSQGQDGAKLNEIRDAQQKIDDAGISNNKHTILTAQDVQVLWDQYVDFLNKKKKMIENEIEHNKLRGITPEQFKEIEDQFKEYDRDNSGTIDRRELKACLYSLGEEKSRTEVDGILKKYGDGKAIKYEGFRELMIDTLGVSDTKEDILNGFFIINRQKSEEKTTRAYMEQVMNEDDVKYIEQTAPKLDDGFAYKPWTEDVFSR